MNYSTVEIQKCIEILRFLTENPGEFAKLPVTTRRELEIYSGRLSRPARDEKKKRNKEAKKELKKKLTEKERNLRAETGIRKARELSVFLAPKKITSVPVEDIFLKEELHSPRNCYICKTEFKKIHFFYDAMCPECAVFNYEKRFQTADLRGMTALITGARLKIGYQTALILLRAGARVVVTTRFPVDASLRYSREEDYPDWKEKLDIYGLDLRHTPSVEIFCNYFRRTYPGLDILINNAAQTVRRPPHFYAHLWEVEAKSLGEIPENAAYLLRNYDTCIGELKKQGLMLSNHKGEQVPGMGLISSAELSKLPYTHEQGVSVEEIFPVGKLDADLQQVDLRLTNSWRLKLGEIQTAEMIELQLINSIAPFVLCNALIPHMEKEYTGKKHIVNVSAMEGKFHRFTKEDRHPHTNMAKAALNMLTHTASGGLAEKGIYMNSVDTGWVTDEDPITLVKRKENLHDFQPPLDIVDGAARVCDPFLHGINTGSHMFGKFLKDYFPIDW